MTLLYWTVWVLLGTRDLGVGPPYKGYMSWDPVSLPGKDLKTQSGKTLSRGSQSLFKGTD